MEHIEDPSACEIIAAWRRGERDSVINTLSAHHPGLTAMVIVQGLADGLFVRSDINAIANLLIERRMHLYQR